MKNESLPFLSSSLDRVQPGCVDIGAPLLNNVIQIHASEQDGKTRLVVSRDTNDVIEVYRQDEQLLQVEIVELLQPEQGQLMSARKNIFIEPLARLFFMNVSTEHSKSIWVATAPRLEIPHLAALQAFAAVVGENSRNKQNRIAFAQKRALGHLSVANTSL